LLFDFFIKIIVDNVESVNQIIKNTYKNKHFYDLNLAINSEYSKDAFNKILEDCPIQKLTYRKELEYKTKEGRMTNYGYIIREHSSERFD